METFWYLLTGHALKAPLPNSTSLEIPGCNRCFGVGATETFRGVYLLRILALCERSLLSRMMKGNGMCPGEPVVKRISDRSRVGHGGCVG